MKKLLPLLLILVLTGCINTNDSINSNTNSDTSSDISSDTTNSITEESSPEDSVSKVVLTNEELNEILTNTYNLKEVKVAHTNFSNASDDVFYVEENLIYQNITLEGETYIYKENEKNYSVFSAYYLSTIELKELDEEVNYNLGYYFKDKFNFEMLNDAYNSECPYGYFEGKQAISFVNSDNIVIDIFVNEENNILNGFLIHDEYNNIIEQVVISVGKCDYKTTLDQILSAL